MRFLISVLLLTPLGCGGNTIVSVSGRVTLNDAPLPHATVIFQPQSQENNPGPGSAGKTDTNGRYNLQLMTGNTAGAMVGKHKVSITAYEGGAEVESSAPGSVFRKPLVPRKYNVESELTFEVPSSGTTSADFNLKTK